jgi:uncharacterized membrane protein (DUF485 family)
MLDDAGLSRFALGASSSLGVLFAIIVGMRWYDYERIPVFHPLRRAESRPRASGYLEDLSRHARLFSQRMRRTIIMTAFLFLFSLVVSFGTATGLPDYWNIVIAICSLVGIAQIVLRFYYLYIFSINLTFLSNLAYEFERSSQDEDNIKTLINSIHSGERRARAKSMRVLFFP